MNEEIIVAVYDTEAHADAAVRDLEAAHVPPTAITRHARGQAASGTPGSSGNLAGEGFWSSLFGGEPDHETAAAYDRSLEIGSSVVTVRVPDEHVDQVTQILERHHPIDIDERAASFGLGANRSAPAPGGTRGAHEAALRDGDEEVIPISEEQLTIGKRLVNPRHDPHPPLRCRDTGGGECNAAFRARLDRSPSRIGGRESRGCRLHRPHHRGDGDRRGGSGWQDHASEGGGRRAQGSDGSRRNSARYCAPPGCRNRA